MKLLAKAKFIWIHPVESIRLWQKVAAIVDGKVYVESYDKLILAKVGSQPILPPD